MSGPEAPPVAPEGEEDLELAEEWRVTKSPWLRLRERTHGNLPLGIGVALLLGYGIVAVAAVVHFGNNLFVLPQNLAEGALSPPPGPDRSHPFGVMGTIGVDILSALFRATPIDLALIGGSVLLAAGIGLFLGTFSALVGGPVDLAVTFCTDLLTTVPPFFFVMVLFLGLQPFLGPPSPTFLLAFGILYALILWPYHARPVRARALQVTGETYVEATRAAGGGTGRLLRRHVIPNSVFPVLAQIPVDVYNFMFVLTVFPFLGLFAGSLFGYLTPLPTTVYPEWGYLLAAGVDYGWSPLSQTDYWWMYAFPAMTVVLFGVGVALACDGMERYLAGARQVR
jgi:peptide/nickel transport system permease protein